MRKTREKKGITLIALIITIVVLLILAAVAINAVTGDGIIQHAVNAKEEYGVAQNKETIQLALNEWKLLKYTPNNTKTFSEFMEEKLEDIDVTSIDEESVKVTLENGTNYKATVDGDIIKIIAFYWDDSYAVRKFYAEEGMTWADFVSSPYNLYEESETLSYYFVIDEENNLFFNEKKAEGGIEGAGGFGNEWDVDAKIIENTTYNLWME